MERIQHCERGISEQRQTKANVKEGSESKCHAEQEQRCEKSPRNRDVAGSKRAPFFPGMSAIGVQVEKVVENIQSRGAKAIKRKANQGTEYGLNRKIVREGERQK